MSGRTRIRKPTKTSLCVREGWMIGKRRSETSKPMAKPPRCEKLSMPGVREKNIVRQE
jgi:hypothetical protein